MSLGFRVSASEGVRDALSSLVASVDDVRAHNTELTVITNHTALSSKARVVVNDGRGAAAGAGTGRSSARSRRAVGRSRGGGARGGGARAGCISFRSFGTNKSI